MRTINIILILILISAIFSAGWIGNELYKDYKYTRNVDGLRFVANNSHTTALEKAKEYDKYGDWVCINVKGMSYERGLEVCNHEMAHEIFAEILEKNPDKIKKVIEALNET